MPVTISGHRKAVTHIGTKSREVGSLEIEEGRKRDGRDEKGVEDVEIRCKMLADRSVRQKWGLQLEQVQDVQGDAATREHDTADKGAADA